MRQIRAVWVHVCPRIHLPACLLPGSYFGGWICVARWPDGRFHFYFVFHRVIQAIRQLLFRVASVGGPEVSFILFYLICLDLNARFASKAYVCVCV